MRTWTELLVLVSVIALAAFLRPQEQHERKRERAHSIEQLLGGRPTEAWHGEATIFVRDRRAVIVWGTKCSIEVSALIRTVERDRIVLQSPEDARDWYTFTVYSTSSGQYLEDERFTATTRRRNGSVIFEKCFRREEPPADLRVEFARMPLLPDWGEESPP